MLILCAWLWGTKYDLTHVAKLVAGARRHLTETHRFILVTDDIYRKGLGDLGVEIVPIIRDRELLDIKGCFARLRMFDPSWQFGAGIKEGDRIVSVDLDVVVTGPLDPLFARPDNFIILTGANAANPCPYNGSIFLFRAGYRPDVWSDFSLDAASKIPFHDFPDDQGWLNHKLPGVVGWKVGPPSGVYAFQKKAWPKGDDLPKDARIVVFPGWRDPSKFTHLSWIQEKWAA